MKIESKSVSIVLLGKFAPDKFSLRTLAEGKLIPQKIADTATYKSLIPGMQVVLKFAWGELLVAQDRFQVTTTEAPYIRICDLSLKAINDLNPEAVVTSFGINCDSHIDIGSREARNKLGVRLAPPEAWGAWGAEIRKGMDGENKMQGGVTHIQMRQQFLDNGVRGWLDVSAMPSPEFENDSGVVLRANHHHLGDISDSGDAKADEKPADITARLIERLAANFENSIANIDTIFKGVISS